VLNIPSYPEFSEEQVWNGRIRLHESIHSYISEIEELEEGMTLLTIRDNRFRFMRSHMSEDYPARTSSPQHRERQLSGVFLWLKGDRLENLMDCTAVYAHRAVKKGLLGKEEAISAKGFVLSSPSIEANQSSPSSNTMFGLRIQGAAHKDFKVESKGMVSFCVGSQVQSLDSEIPGTSSRTYVVVCSNEHPFVAYIRRSEGIKRLVCDSDNIKEESIEAPSRALFNDPSGEEVNDLFQLKLRLLKGEITRDEFEQRRSKLESA
jgi:hypothetical protein